MTLTADSSGALSGEFQVRESGLYHLELETGIGEPRAASEPFVLTLPDLQPGSQPPAIPTSFTLFGYPGLAMLFFLVAVAGGSDDA